MSARRVLVTGASGFVGRHVLAPLREQGFEVHAVGRRPPAQPAPDVTWHALDLLEPRADLAGTLRAVAPSHLLHLAWNAEPGAFWTARDNLAWLAASTRLYTAFAEAGGERAVLAGTCAEYDWGHGVCVEDSTPLRPATLYGAAKAALGGAVGAYAAAHGPSTAWGRIFFLYGPHEHPSRLVAAVAGGLLRGEPVAVTHGRQVRDFLHVADVAGAFAALVAHAEVTGPVNVASGEPVSLRQLLGTLSECAERPELVSFGARPAPEGEPLVLVADARRLREVVGFRPRFTLETGLEETLEWWRRAL